MSASDRSVIIDCFPDSVRRYQEAYAVVAVDVIRATTTAITAVARGRRCFPVESIEMAVPLAARLHWPLLVGELGGSMPYGFDMNNSPAEIDHRKDVLRPMILLSTSGTALMQNAQKCDAAYVACLRNHTATASHLADRHSRVALIGAGARGEFREEDQLCCAWIAEKLLAAGYRPEDESTLEIVGRWRGASPEACARGKSAEYLRRSGQTRDLEFILSHVDDLDAVFAIKQDEIVRLFVGD